MQVTVETGWIVHVLLVACRLGPLFVLVPVFGASGIPARFKVLFGLSLAVLLVMGVPSSATALPATPGGVVLAAMGEVVVGLAIAFGLLAVFAAFSFAGRVLDLQIGFGVATLFDPVTRAQAPLLGTALVMLATVVFFSLDGHHLVLRAVAWSLTVLPPGSPPWRLEFGAVAAQFGVVFSWGLVLAAPALVALLLLDMGFAMLSRTMPQMNVFVVSMPLKVIVGLVMLALSMHHLLPAMRRLFGTLPAYWQGVLVPAG